jgi:hypothetical protein
VKKQRRIREGKMMHKNHQGIQKGTPLGVAPTAVRMKRYLKDTYQYPVTFKRWPVPNGAQGHVTRVQYVRTQTYSASSFHRYGSCAYQVFKFKEKSWKNLVWIHLAGKLVKYKFIHTSKKISLEKNIIINNSI